MANAPKKPAPPAPDNDRQLIEGEMVDVTERAMARSGNAGGDLDASLAVALSQGDLDTQIVTAHKYPRQVQRIIDQITQLATLDTETATECNYSLPRGRDADGKANAITGPSIRFAELVAQQWGHNRVAARTVAVDRKEKFIEAEGIYHDLATNSVVAVRTRRKISTKNGGLYSEDMIVVTGNAAASIALRNAILRGVPRPIWRKAYRAVEGVIRGDVATLGARRVALLTKFHDELGIKPAQVYAILGVKGEQDVGLDELVVAAGFYSALRNNEITVEDLLRQATPAGGRSLSAAFGEPAKPAVVESTNGDKVDQATGEVTEQTAAAAAAEPAADMSGSATPSGENGASEPAAWPEPVDDCASDPDEVYHLAADGVGEDGKRPSYQNGKPFSRSGPKGGLPVYTRHPDDGEDSRQEEEGAADGADGVVVVEASAEHTDAFNAYAAKVQAADSWLTVKAALSAFRKTDAFVSASEDMQVRARLLAYNHTAGLQDPVTPDADPAYFALWLLQAERQEVRPMFSKLVRTKAYQNLPDVNKDAIAEEVNRASGEM